MNALYAMGRLKYAMPDRPLATVGFDEIRTLVAHFASRPLSPSTGRKLAPDTVIDTLNFVRAFFGHLSDTGHWPPPAPLDRLFRYSRDKLFTDAELEQRQEVKVFTADELRVLWMSCANDFQQLLFLLALNCGFTQQEVSTLAVRHCHLDGPRPFIRRRRFKTKVPGQWRLWPETAALLRKWIAGHDATDMVFARESGQPLVYFAGRHRYDAVHHEWRKIRKRADARFDHYEETEGWKPPHLLPPGFRPPVKVRPLGYKHLRKTGSDMIRRIAGKDTAEVYLAHADPTLARVYNNRDFKKLAKALRKMRRALEPVLGPLPPADKRAAEPDGGPTPRAA